MHDNFLKVITDIYNLLKEPIDIIYKQTSINYYKVQLNIGVNGSFGDYYFNMLQNKKENGLIYTPVNIANYIIENTIKAEDIIRNPFLKILDPACGCGNIIIPCFLFLNKIYLNNLKEINLKNKLQLTEKDISLHIMQNNLFGFDIDEISIKVLEIDLFNLSGDINCNNFHKKDFLVSKAEEFYDVIIGNPPYIGQKSMDKQYSLILKELYKGLYLDKGDISYCFFGAALNNLEKQGKLTFITSRYFIEAPSGEVLRKTLKETCSINKIVDYYGVRPFKNAGIDPVIIFTTKEHDNCKVEIIKPLINKEKYFSKQLYEGKEENINKFNINKHELMDSGWVLINEAEKTIVKKLEERCITTLNNICYSYQGIITGCDKAFVVDESDIKAENLERELLKPWIKNSCIEKFQVKSTGKFIIYSDIIDEERKYKNAIKHIETFREKLQERRECRTGIRPWYKLQWGRVQEIFEGEKIIFPFKASNNRFAYDIGSYFSADVYCLTLKSSSKYNYDFLLKLLNSKLYEFYFKTFAKKLGESLYDYYPNNLMKLGVPSIIEIGEEVDKELYSYFNITEEEIKIIELYIN